MYQRTSRPVLRPPTPPRPGLPAQAPAPVQPRPVAAIFTALDVDWRRRSQEPGGTEVLALWSAREPCLAGCRDVGQVVALVGWLGFQPTEQGRQVLRCLLHLAHEDLAARALLQALLPRARAERVVTARFGHGLGENWQVPADTVADFVAECFAAIKRHAGEDRPDVARLVIQEATRRLRTARQAQRRYQERVVPSGPEGAGPAADLFSARTSAEWVAASLCQAVRAGHLSKAQASLLYGARVKGLPASEVGRAAGLAPKAVYYALARAEEALSRRAA